MKWLSLLFCAAFLTTFAQPSEPSKPTVIFLVRHAEKSDDGTRNPPLSEAGNRRAQRLAETLRPAGLTAIYSTDYKRTRETVEPVAKEQNQAVKMYEPMKEDVLKKIIEENRGGVILICGHSNTTPWSANWLAGTQLENFSESEYGNILIVTLWNDGRTSMTKINY